MIKHHDKGNLRKKGLEFMVPEEQESVTIQGNMAAGRQAGMALLQQLRVHISIHQTGSRALACRVVRN